jgi:hypothetical protein
MRSVHDFIEGSQKIKTITQYKNDDGVFGFHADKNRIKAGTMVSIISSIGLVRLQNLNSLIIYAVHNHRTNIY